MLRTDENSYPVTRTVPDIIYENERFVAVHKPAGLLSIPDREGSDISMKRLLQDKYGSIFTVHRLDRDTSGIMLFARTEAAHQFLSKAFEVRTIEKYYLGLVTGIIPEKKGTIEAPIMEHPGKRGVMVIHKRGKEAITDYEVLEELGKFSLVQFQIHTGRTHQIRVHMQKFGHPIVCDELYGNGQPIFLSSIKRNFKLSKNEWEERPILSRLGLHAHRLVFTDADGSIYKLEAELPKDMRALLQQLRKRG